jgi:hypothetical protein
LDFALVGIINEAPGGYIINKNGVFWKRKFLKKQYFSSTLEFQL